jgi:hypothetical protein
MSRSKKYTPIFKDGTARRVRQDKTIANQKVRRSDGVADGNFYRRIYNSYNIHDNIWSYFRENDMEYIDEPWAKVMSK